MCLMGECSTDLVHFGCGKSAAAKATTAATIATTAATIEAKATTAATIATIATTVTRAGTASTIAAPRAVWASRHQHQHQHQLKESRRVMGFLGLLPAQKVSTVVQ